MGRLLAFLVALLSVLHDRRGLQVLAMLSKNKRAYDRDEIPPTQRLKRNIQDIFASNELSGSRCHELCADAAARGLTEFNAISRRGKSAS